MYICILGRQPALGMAELERLYGSSHTSWFSDECALVTAPSFDFDRLGGSLKAGRVVAELSGNWAEVSKKIVSEYALAWAHSPHKITLGISAYGFKAAPRDVQKTGILLKQKLKKTGTSLRLIPNDFTALNTAASHHNKLGLSSSKVELLVVRSGSGKVIIAESVGAQNITAIAARDQARPHTDAFVGMLPPKLARMMLNMATADDRSGRYRAVVFDPFCGTGVVLQEALLDGHAVIGTDLSEKMVDYTTKNLAWLKTKFRLTNPAITVALGDATKFTWSLKNTQNVCVVSETYLGQPFSAPPKPAKLAEVRGNCNHIISSFLRNIHPQLPASTPLCLAVPAWRGTDGTFTRLPLTRELSTLGFEQVTLKNVRPQELLYYRETQVVARELLLLVKK